MTGNEYQDLAARTINKGLTFEEQKFHALHGMVGEIGEIHSIYQKMYQGHAFEVDHVKKNLGIYFGLSLNIVQLKDGAWMISCA